MATLLCAPDIAVLGFNHCITDLSQRYRNSMQLTLHLDTQTPKLSSEQEIAIYRICEQALLNAALHGKAQHCSIQTSYDNAGNITVSIENNGGSPCRTRRKDRGRHCSDRCLGE